MLRQIEYFRGLPENIIIQIAFLMTPEHRLPGTQLFSFHADFQDEEELEAFEAAEFEADEFYIIFDGLVVVEALIDQTDFISIDYLSRGSIIRPHHFLVNRSNTVKYTVLETCLIYVMRLETLALLSVDYP